MQAPQLAPQKENKSKLARLSAFLGDVRAEAGAMMHAVSVTSWLTDVEPDAGTPGGAGDSPDRRVREREKRDPRLLCVLCPVGETSREVQATWLFFNVSSERSLEKVETRQALSCWREGRGAVCSCFSTQRGDVISLRDKRTSRGGVFGGSVKGTEERRHPERTDSQLLHFGSIIVPELHEQESGRATFRV